MTRRYLKLTQEDLQAEYQRFHHVKATSADGTALAEGKLGKRREFPHWELSLAALSLIIVLLLNVMECILHVY